MDADCAKQLFGQFLTGVSVVTCPDASGRAIGMTASAITPLSLSPPSLIVCIGTQADVLPAIAAHGRFSVHLLRAGQDQRAWAFAMTGEEQRTRIAALDLEWTTTATGTPIWNDALARLDCRLREAFDGGDHRILVGDIESGQFVEQARPLVYFRGRIGGDLRLPDH